ncbi:6978_t:CDS:1, partial [Paraglomus brasilianum]
KTNDNNAGESEAKNDTAKIEKLTVKSDQESETYLSTSTTREKGKMAHPRQKK